MTLTPAPSSPLHRFLVSWWVLPCVVLALLSIHLSSIAVPPLAGTEGHRIVTAHQMLERNEFLVPKLYGYNYLLKPPLYYWTLATFEAAFGGRNFIWRLPSALAHAGLLALCFVFARRWFGAVAGGVAGLAFLLLIALWQEARTADIDPVNNLASTATALILAELLLRDPRRKWPWVLAGALTFGAALLLKLPAVIPALVIPIAGTLAVRRPTLRVVTPLVLAILGGVGVFAAWAVPLVIRLRAEPSAMDAEGAAQGAGKLVPESLSVLLNAVSLPPSLFVFALPASVALVFIFHRVIWSRRREVGSAEQLMVAIGLGILTSWLLCMLSGMDNPRYAYVTLPILAVVAGGVFTRLYPEPGGRTLASVTLLSTTVGLLIAPVILLLQIRRIKGPAPFPPLSTEIYIAIGLLAVIALLTLFAIARGHLARATFGLVLVLVLLGLPFSEFSNRRRDTRSGIHAARVVDKLLPRHTPITTAALLYYQPELFFYLSRPTTALGRPALRDPSRFQPATTYLLDDEEILIFRKLPPEKIKRQVEFLSNKSKCYLVETAP